jgi:hypothetical protein
MEWQIPIQKVEIGNINIGTPWARQRQAGMKPMAPLSYHSPQVRLQFLSILFPPLPVVEYNPVTSRLVLEMAETNLACIKLNTFQETLISSIHYNQYNWFRTEYTKEQIQQGFQPIIQGTKIIFHCPSGDLLNIWKDGVCMKKGLGAGELKPGTRIRLAVKLLGLSFLTKAGVEEGSEGEPEVWSGKCRIQHKIRGIVIMPE